MAYTQVFMYEVIEVLQEAHDEHHDFTGYPARALLIDCFPDHTADEIDEVLHALHGRMHEWHWLI